MNIDRNELDRYITREDQPQEDEPEFYGPWRVTNRKKPVTIADIITVVWDDNGNPMCYAEDDYFMTEAIKRINAYPAMLTLVREIAKDYPDAADWKDVRSKLYAMANGIMQKVPA